MHFRIELILTHVKYMSHARLPYPILAACWASERYYICSFRQTFCCYIFALAKYWYIDKINFVISFLILIYLSMYNISLLIFIYINILCENPWSILTKNSNSTYKAEYQVKFFKSHFITVRHMHLADKMQNTRIVIHILV